MLILLPPSESKTGRAMGKPADLQRVSFPELASTRAKVAAALAQISAHPDAPALLGVSATLRADIAHNLRLGSAPAVRVADLYTGVLYDALDLASMDPVTRRRANRWLVVVSALFGALRPADKIPPYRLSMGVNLGELGPLAAVWRAPLSSVLPLAAGRGMIVDARSSTYGAAWVPKAVLANRWVQIRVPGATHMAKHTRGLVARYLCQTGVDARSAQALEQVVSQRFDTTLTAPTRPGHPWILDTSIR
ncbi:MAG: peroxide stress protein YaaA [Dermatophilaceae bacterium]